MLKRTINIEEKEELSFSDMKEMGYTIVHKVVMENDFDKLLTCLEEGVNPNITGMLNNTPLHLAVLNKNDECFDLLMAYEADPNAKNKKGITPFHYAIMTNNMPMVNKMLTRNADVLTPLRNGMLPQQAAIEVSDNKQMSEHIEAIANMQSIRSRLEQQNKDDNNVIQLSFKNKM